MVGPYFLGMSLFPYVPTVHPLHLSHHPTPSTPPPPARLLPAACLAGPVPTHPPMTGLSPACCRAMS